jgi:hypothetical protein
LQALLFGNYIYLAKSTKEKKLREQREKELMPGLIFRTELTEPTEKKRHFIFLLWAFGYSAASILC